jgi:lantibiotic modifying enzyme
MKTNLELCFEIESGSYIENYIKAKNEYLDFMKTFISRYAVPDENFDEAFNDALDIVINNFYENPSTDEISIYQEIIYQQIISGSVIYSIN